MTRSTGQLRPALLAVQHTRSRTVGRALDQQPETEEYDLSADSSDTSSRSACALLRDTRSFDLLGEEFPEKAETGTLACPI